jgi:predicted nucleotidyltransferase
MPHEPLLQRLIAPLSKVRGLVAIALGGSRARGTAHATSDYDIGLYFSQTTASRRILLAAPTTRWPASDRCCSRSTSAT